AAGTAGGAQTGTVELRLHGFSAGAEGEYWPKVAGGFNAAHDRIKVTFEPYVPDKGVLVLGAAGTLGDVMRLVGFADYAQVAAKGFLRDLGPLIAHDRFDLKPFYPAAVETLRFRGKQYGLPLFAHPGFCVHFANTEAFGRAGVPPPDDMLWTFDDLARIAKQLSGPARGDEGGSWGIWPPTSIQHVMVAARA